MKHVRRLFEFVVLAVLSNVIACASDATTEQVQALVSSVVIQLGMSTLVVGQSVQAGAIARGASGGTLTGILITWSSSNPDIISVDPSGLVKAIRPGVADISASASGQTTAVTLTVVDAPVSVVTVTLSANSVIVGQSVSATATIRDSINQVLMGRTVEWKSSDTSVATISAAGSIATVGAGATSITATSDGIVGSAPLTVIAAIGSVTVSLGSSNVPVGAFTSAVATVRDVTGNVITDRPVTWSTSNPNVATVTAAGLVSGIAAGTATIYATVEDRTGFATVTIGGSGSGGGGGTTRTPAQLVIVGQPSNVSSGLNIAPAPVIEVRDASNLLVSTATNAITVSIASGTGTLDGHLTVNAVSGVATFPNIRVTGSGAQTLRFASTGLTTATSASFNVVAAQATQLAITTQPSPTATSGVTLAPQPTIQAGDASNNPVAQGGVVVTAAIATGGGALGGTTSVVTNASGSATFTNLSITGAAGTSVTLSFTAASLAGVTSNAVLITAAQSGSTSAYFNSSEPGCDGSDPNVLFCDDFESGSWYTMDCDTANAAGGIDVKTRGWCGTIFNAAGLAAGTARCSGAGFRSSCAATTGVMSGGTTGNMADHALLNRQGVDEIWVRFYTKPLSGYQFGAEKMLTFNDGVPGDGGIKWGNLSWNCAGTTQATGNVTMGFPVPMDLCQSQNMGNSLVIQPGNWYFYEVHYKLSSPGGSDGIFELWLDNCGPSGTSCPATPTQRMRLTNVQNSRTSTSQLIRVLWFEAWSNPVSLGERYWDQIKVSKVGPIGFMP
jgi:Bacterial Ig-like domain (group 2)